MFPTRLCLLITSVIFIIHWLMSPEIPKNPETDSHYEATVEFCSRINQALEIAARLRKDPHNEELESELSMLEGRLKKDGFHGIYHFRLIIPEGANARTSRFYDNFVDTSPRDFPADSVNRIDITQADFYYSRGDSTLHLTSFDFNLTAEPFAS